jgi:hypothetical protein
MEQLEKLKARSIVIPKMVSRYVVACYSNAAGWEIFASRLHTTPESALEDFNSFHRKYPQDADYKVKYYKVVELELELPLDDVPR